MARPKPLDQIDEGTAKVDAVLARNAEIIAAVRAEGGQDESDRQFIERMEAVRSAFADIRSLMIEMRASFADSPVRPRTRTISAADVLEELERNIQQGQND